MKRKTVAKLLGAALTLAMAGTSAQAMTSTYVDGNRTVYIYHGDEMAEITITQNADGSITATSSTGDDVEIELSETAESDLSGDAVIEDVITYHIEDSELEEGGYYEYSIIEAGEDAESMVITGEDAEGMVITVTDAEGIADDQAELEQLLAELETVGITSDEESGELFYEGKSIRWLLDEQSSDGYAIVRVEGGEIDVFTVRDADGTLTGVKVAE